LKDAQAPENTHKQPSCKFQNPSKYAKLNRCANRKELQRLENLLRAKSKPTPIQPKLTFPKKSKKGQGITSGVLPALRLRHPSPTAKTEPQEHGQCFQRHSDWHFAGGAQSMKSSWGQGPPVLQAALELVPLPFGVAEQRPRKGLQNPLKPSVIVPRAKASITGTVVPISLACFWVLGKLKTSPSKEPHAKEGNQRRGTEEAPGTV
jgi:hypothetical protein